jgi:1,4-dihydroxy-2-naphthoate octaprenyltransferase
MTKKQAWVEAIRPRTLPLSLSGILLGSFIAKFNGYWNTTIFVLALITTVFFQILSNLANDLGDSLKGADNENRVGPMRSVQSGVITKKEMRNAVMLTALLSLISAGFLLFIGTQNLPLSALWVYCGLALACVLAAITYTIGKRAYGYHGFGDIMVFLFFGIVSVMGVYPLFSKSFDWNLIYPASCIGLLSASVLNLNNMRDCINDAKSGKKTLVVIMGPNVAKLYHAGLILGGWNSMAYYIDLTKHLMGLIGVIPPGIVLLFHLRKAMKITNPEDFDPELKVVALATFAIALLTSIGLMVG